MPRIPVFPLDVVLFPGEDMPLHVFEERYLLMVDECLAHGEGFGVALARQGQPADRVEVDPVAIGTLVDIVESEKLTDGRMIIVVRGRRRFRIRRVLSERLYQEADVEWLGEAVGDARTAAAATEGVRHELDRVGVAEILEDAGDPVETAYRVAAALEAPLPLRQKLLEAHDAAERLLMEQAILRVVEPLN